MESQIQIQSESMELLMSSPNGNNASNIAERTRQQRQQVVNNSNSNRTQQRSPQKQTNTMSRVLIVSPNVQHQNPGPTVTTRSASERKALAVSQQPQAHQTSHLHHQMTPTRQLVIQQPPVSPKSSTPNIHGSHIGTSGQQQQLASVQNGQLVITNLSPENRLRHSQQQQQQQLHQQQRILIIQQSDQRILEEEDKSIDLQSQDPGLSLGVAQTITVAVSDSDGRGGDGSSTAIYPTLQYVTSSGEPVVASHHVVGGHHHPVSSVAGGGPSAADATHVIYHSPVPTNNQHAAVHLQPGAYAVYPGDAGGYSPQGHHYYPVSGQVTYQTPLHSPTSTYIIQSGGGSTLQHSPLGSGSCNPIVGIHEDDVAAQQLSHTTRASPATIQWLLQNYETAEGVSLPRCTLYNHYLKHCSEHKLDPVNAASFGKLIRSVFLGLRTRRLGTRGNSKYHYYGIRIKPESPLNRISDESMATMAMRQQPTNQSRRQRPVVSTPPATASQQSQSGLSSGSATGPLQVPLGGSSNTAPMSQHGQVNMDAGSATGTPNSIHSTNAAATALPINAPGTQTITVEGNKHYVGDGVVPDVMPPPSEHLEPQLDRLGLTAEDAARFFSGYRAHCEEILECVKNLLFSDVERCWRQFWQPDDIQRGRMTSDLDQDIESDLDDDDSMSGCNLTGLTRMQLYSLCTLPVVQEFIQTMDFQFYQVLVDVLIPNVLKLIPSTLTQSIRNFAKRLESGLGLALQGAPDVIVRIKLDAVGSLAQTLRRYTSLNHLAQAARAVLQNGTQIQQMLADLNRVDFHNVQEQASWVCDCDPALVDQIEKDFKSALERQKTLEQWGSWLETVVDQVLGSYGVLNILHGSRQEHDASVVRLTTVARQFLLKWSFYSSMVMRDLTLRSAPSFGSFHLIRLLYDEYMFYLVEQRVARMTGQTTIAVMSQSYRSHVASLAVGVVEQDYQSSYTLQQQHLSQDHRGIDADMMGRNQVHNGMESYATTGVETPGHHFGHHQGGATLLESESTEGDASLAGMDRTSTGAVIVLSQGHSNADAASTVVTIPLGVSADDVVATYVMHPNTNVGDEQQVVEEGNVADEFFITTTIHEDPPNKHMQLTESTASAETASADAAAVLSSLAAAQSTIDWEQEQGQRSTETKYDSAMDKTMDTLESATPVKKRKHSFKYNGDGNIE